MNVFDGKILKYSSAALYILLSFISFYCACYRLPVSIKYAINFVVLGWACLVFFIRPQFDRALFCLRMLAIFFFPYLLFWMCSVGIWISEFQTFSYILRGSLNIFYMFTNILYVCGAFYLFDSDVMFYTVVGMAMANSLVALQTAASFGIGTFIAEYIRLLATFADDTGGAMRTMELHDMVWEADPAGFKQRLIIAVRQAEYQLLVRNARHEYAHIHPALRRAPHRLLQLIPRREIRRVEPHVIRRLRKNVDVQIIADGV